MMTAILRMFCLVAAMFLSSCSCGIYHEHWKNDSGSRKITTGMISEGIAGSRFRQVKSGAERMKYRKGASFIEFTEKDQVILFHSAFCPFPWQLLFGDESFGEIRKVEHRLIGSMQQRGLPMRKLTDDEVTKRYR